MASVNTLEHSLRTSSQSHKTLELWDTLTFQGLLQVKTKCTTKLEDCCLKSSANSVSRQTKLVLCGWLFTVQIGQRSKDHLKAENLEHG